MATSIALAATVASWPVLALWRAYCIVILWGWFVTPAYGWNAPSMYFLVGCLLTLHMALPVKRPHGDDAPPLKWFTDNFVFGIVAPPLTVALGWVWRWLQWGVA